MIATRQKKAVLGRPLKYPGGKSFVAKQLFLCRPPHFDEYREPFCGGSLVWDYKVLPLSMPRWINDLDEPLINFYRCMRDDESFIPRFLEIKRKIIGHADRTLAAFEAAKSDYRTNPVSYLILRRFALNQVVRESRKNIASVSYNYLSDPAMLRRFTLARMNAWRQLLQDVKITCDDYMSVVSKPVKRGQVCWTFLDPPYSSNLYNARGAEIYEQILDQNGHERLRDKLAALNPKKHKFLLTLCNSEMSKNFYALSGKFYIWDRRMIYGMMAGNVQKRVVKEIVVTNYPI